MTSPRLLAVGAAHIDRRGRVSGAYVPAASNPGTMREEVGGGVFNALRNAVRHGAAGALMSVRGGDVAGEAVARAVGEARIDDLSVTFLDRTTPSYTALLDADGELIAGFADMGLYDLAFAKQMRRRSLRDAVASADAVLCDANMPAAAIEALASALGGKPLFAVAISPAKIVRLAGSLRHLSCLFMNAVEARTLAGLGAEASAEDAARALLSRGLRRAAITAGRGSLVALDENGLFLIEPPSLPKVSDVTGAGDALAGVTVSRLMQGDDFRRAVRAGIAAATLTVESPTVVANYADEDFAARLALVGEVRAVA